MMRITTFGFLLLFTFNVYGDTIFRSGLEAPDVFYSLEFDDPNLSVCVALFAQSQGWVSISEMTSLTCSNMGIASVDGIEQLFNLQDLQLRDNEITNVSSLGDLTELTLLHLDRNQITSVSGFEALTLMQELALNDNNITDISNLVTMTQLALFHVDQNDFGIPCDQLALFSGVANYKYDEFYDVDSDGEITLPPEGNDEECGPY